MLLCKDSADEDVQAEGKKNCRKRCDTISFVRYRRILCAFFGCSCILARYKCIAIVAVSFHLLLRAIFIEALNQSINSAIEILCDLIFMRFLRS